MHWVYLFPSFKNLIFSLCQREIESKEVKFIINLWFLWFLILICDTLITFTLITINFLYIISIIYHFKNNPTIYVPPLGRCGFVTHKNQNVMGWYSSKTQGGKKHYFHHVSERASDFKINRIRAYIFKYLF